MPGHTLSGRRILVVEDEYMLADELRSELGEADAEVLGPVGTLEAALALINATPRIDGAVLDVNLGGEMAYPAADLLIERRVPVVFTTGYDDSVIPGRFANVVRCAKPSNIGAVMQAIRRMVHA